MKIPIIQSDEDQVLKTALYDALVSKMDSYSKSLSPENVNLNSLNEMKDVLAQHKDKIVIFLNVLYEDLNRQFESYLNEVLAKNA